MTELPTRTELDVRIKGAPLGLIQQLIADECPHAEFQVHPREVRQGGDPSMGLTLFVWIGSFRGSVYQENGDLKFVCNDATNLQDPAPTQTYETPENLVRDLLTLMAPGL